jgi:hypothetical protein
VSSMARSFALLSSCSKRCSRRPRANSWKNENEVK